MIPKNGNVSLLAVRDDVGKAGSFSMSSREAKNKLNWDDSNRSLTQYRGNALGLQFRSGGPTLNTYQPYSFGNSYFGSQIGEPLGANSQTQFPSEPRQLDYLQLQSKRSGNSDSWSENRHQAVVHGGALVTVSMYYKAEGSTFSYCRLALLANSTGFLQGSQQIIIDTRPTTGSWRKYTSRQVSIPASHPYVSLILYSISTAQENNYNFRTQQYTSLKLQA
jgi:hypothetical protein